MDDSSSEARSAGRRPSGAISERAIEALLDATYVAADGAGLRDEDRKKARELAPLLEEIARIVERASRKEPFVLVDAAAGKSYVGLFAAKLVLEALGREGRVVAIEREPRRVEASVRAADRLGLSSRFEGIVADVRSETAFPSSPSLVVALHACGEAADAVLEAAIAREARHLLLVPCCTSHRLRGAELAEAWAAPLGIPKQAGVRRRFVQSIVDAERTLRLEAAGYETEAVELVPPSVTPHNLLFRARRVREPGRMAAARMRLDALHAVYK
ncbi:MAG: methyltransferase [Polyangiales bacterium]